MLISFGSAILLNVDKIIIGWALGPKGVAYYAVPTQIALKIHTGLASFVSFIFPLSSEVQSIGDKETLRKIYLKSMRFIIMIDGLIMVFIGTFSHELLTLWIDNEFAIVSEHILIFTAIGYLSFSLSIVPYYILLGTGHPREFALLNIATTSCVILGFFVGLNYFGLIGGTVGAMIGMGTMFLLPRYVQNLIGISWGVAYRDSYGRTFICSVSALAFSLILPPSFIAKLIFYFVFMLVLFYCGNIKQEDLGMIHDSAKKFLVNVSVRIRLKGL